jgi:hypothetical protein
MRGLMTFLSMAVLMKRLAAAPDHSDVLHQRLMTCGTKTGLISAIALLEDAGWLKPDVVRNNTSSTRQRLTNAVKTHSEAQTPYGPVVQRMSLPLAELPHWDFVHPMAFLYHMTSISVPFADLMRSIAGGTLRLIIYIDEICPGNPLRPEKSRTLQAIYWAFAEWPQHVLQRTACWPVFGTIRSTLVKKLQSEVAGLMRRVLHVFFPAVGMSLANGIYLCQGSVRFVVKVAFAGFLADEKAHKELTLTKGASGMKPCITCHNVFGRIDVAALADGCVHIKCPDPSLFQINTNEMIFAYYDHIAASCPTDRPSLRTQLGVNYSPGGLLDDHHIRTFYKPVDHTLRDWLHTLVSGGVCNVECAELIKALGMHGIGLEVLADFLTKFVLAKRHGKTDATWLSKKRLGKQKKTLQSFAGVMLSIMPILSAFLDDVVSADHPLHDNAVCFRLLTTIVMICSLGPELAMIYIDVLKELIEAHARLYVALYPNAPRPKFHHLFHIVDGMKYLGKLLSCFVTERKHRATKRCALFVFRHIDNTVVKHMLNKQCDALASQHSLFLSKFLVQPKVVTFMGVEFLHSTSALMHCGIVFTNDLVWTSCGSVGSVIGFWAKRDLINIIINLNVYAPLGNNRWDPAVVRAMSVDSEDVYDTVMYAPDGDLGNVVRVVPPVRASL